MQTDAAATGDNVISAPLIGIGAQATIGTGSVALSNPNNSLDAATTLTAANLERLYGTAIDDVSWGGGRLFVAH